MRTFDYIAEKVWLDETYIYTQLKDGREAKMPIEWFRQLKNSTPEQRANFEIIGGYALHWPQLDEDLTIEGFFNYNKNGKSNNR